MACLNGLSMALAVCWHWTAPQSGYDDPETGRDAGSYQQAVRVQHHGSHIIRGWQYRSDLHDAPKPAWDGICGAEGSRLPAADKC